MKNILAYSFLCLTVFSCSNQEKQKTESADGWQVTLRGKVGFPSPGGTISLTEIGLGGDVDDTIALKSDYSFEKTVTLKEPGYYRLNFYDLQYVDMILDKSDLEINVDGNSQGGFAEVNGSPDHALIAQVQKGLQEAQSGSTFRSIESDYQLAVGRKDQQRAEALQQAYMDKLYDAQDSVLRTLIQQPLSLGLINILEGNMFDKDENFVHYRQAADRVAREWPGSRYGKKFVEMVEEMAITAVGQPAPEISLPDQNGDTLKLSSLQGKYVLVDFWAKWCGPCRRENPNVVEAYKKYRGPKFEILGVSLDRSRVDWLQAIEEDNLTWKHVSDLKYFGSQAAMDYNINAIPFSILVDPKGVIVAKNLRGAALHRKLAEIFGKKS
jgi:peroxiredoxin